MNTLLVDIGNSRVKVRAARLDDDRPARDVDDGWLGATRSFEADEVDRIAGWFDAGSATIDAIVVSNVASPDLGAAIEAAAARRWPDAPIARVVAERERCGVVNGYATPATLGVDRWMALLATRSWLADRSALVCSFGTATTLDLLVPSPRTASSTFVGGLILPGFEAMRRALSKSTARLPLVPGRVRDFADETADAMTSGVLTAQAGAVERAWRQASVRADAAAASTSPQCVLTGGNAAAIADALSDSGIDAIVRPDLVLHGLRLWARDTLVVDGCRPRRAVNG